MRVGVARPLRLSGRLYLGKRLEGLAVAKVIAFYIPATFSKRVKWLPPQVRGKVLEFRLPATKSA